MFRFGASEWLWALFVVPLVAALFWISYRARHRALERFGDSPLVARLTRSVSERGRFAKAVLLVTALALTVVALARPQFGTRVETVQSRGQDVMVALDLSASMLAEDVSPNRLERARLSVLRLMRQLDGDRVGLVAFAADAFVQSPLTVDYGAAAMFLNAMTPDIMPVQGTNLGAALRVSLDALRDAREARVLVVVTDGEDHEGEIDEQIQRAVASGVRIHTVGLGSAEGVPIPVFDAQGRRQGFKRDEDGNVVTTHLDEETLMRVAEATGGRYVRAGGSAAALDELVDEIAGVDGEAVDARQITQFEERYQIFLGLALALLMAEVLVSDRRKTDHEWVGRFDRGMEGS